MRMNKRLYKKIDEISELGDFYLDIDEYDKALEQYNKALELIPEPKYQCEASALLYVSIGDAYYYKEMYQEAISNLKEALKCPEGMENPYINLRIGESYYELGELSNAKRYLVEAYIGAGREIFKEESEKYFKLLEGDK